MNYTLDDNGNPVYEPNLRAWTTWFESSNRQIERTQIGDVWVSTVFLGIDHSFSYGPPVLWETMVFGGEFDELTERYTSLDDAKMGHARIVAQVRAAIGAEGEGNRDAD